MPLRQANLGLPWSGYSGMMNVSPRSKARCAHSPPCSGWWEIGQDSRPQAGDQFVQHLDGWRLGPPLQLSIIGAADAKLPCEFLLTPCTSGLDESAPQMYPPPTELVFVYYRMARKATRQERGTMMFLLATPMFHLQHQTLQGDHHAGRAPAPVAPECRHRPC